MPADTTYHDEGTLERARRALVRHGLNATEVIRILNNDGILLREAEPTVTERPLTGAQEPVEVRQALRVECKTTVPLGTVTEALSMLQAVPISATLGLSWSPSRVCRCPITSEDRPPVLVARWEEPR